MSKIIFFALIVAVIYFGWRSMRIKQIKLEKQLDEQKSEKNKDLAKSEAMVRCAQCGVYVPISEAIADGNNFFCCEEHRKKGAR